MNIRCLSTTILVLLTTIPALARQNDVRPEDTEVWSPVPPVVAPGDPSPPISFRSIWVREL